MTVYVDDMRAPVRGFKLCHMLADSTAELLAMGRAINLPPTCTLQHPGTAEEHFDIALSKRALAVKRGARLVPSRKLVKVIQAKRAARQSPAPEGSSDAR